MKWLIAFFVALLLPTIALAACPTTSLTFKDAAGATQTLCFGGASGAFIPQYQILDSAGTNALTVSAAGAAKVDGSAVTQPISAANLPLPTGAATAAGLTTINTTLGSPFQAGGALAANQSVNVAQINSVTPLMGNGATGTGSHRTTVSSDNSAVANWGQGATGSAVPTGAQYLGGSSSGNLTGQVLCDNHVFKHITTATDTLAVQGVTSKTIKICGVKAQFAGTATFYLENTASTNANCASTLTQIYGLVSGVANISDGFYSPIWGGFVNTSGNGLCINSTGTGGFDIDIWYTQGS